MKPYIGKRAYIPRKLISPRKRKQFLEELTYTQYQQDTVKTAAHRQKVYGYSEAEEQVICNYRLSHAKRMVSLPRDWALEKFGLDFFTDKTTDPKHKITFPKDIAPRDERQRLFFEGIYQKAVKPGPQQILANATTGCHAAGTKVIMFDGTTKNVEDVRVGDLLIGPDSKPRKVLRLITGQQDMYEIAPTKGESFVVNKDHILHLKRTRSFYGDRNPLNRARQQAGEVTHITVSDYLQKSDSWKHVHKLERSALHFEGTGNLSVDPYILGLWLGDGTSRSSGFTTMDQELSEAYSSYAMSVGDTVAKTWSASSKAHYINVSGSNLFRMLKQLDLIQNKHIPHSYLTAKESDRLLLLAGLIDTDGSKGVGYYEIIQKKKRLVDAILFLARSLGFAAYCRTKLVRHVPYYRVTISGDVSRIPVKLPRKICQPRQQKKNVLVTGFTVKPVGEGSFYGFTLSDDHLYLTSDFTIHHNSGKSVASIKLGMMLRTPTLIVVDSNKLAAGFIKNFDKFFGQKWRNKYVGRIQQDQCDYEGKAFCIALVQSLRSRKYPAAMYKYFGCIIYDEVQIYGSSYHDAMGMFSARVLVGMTATNKSGSFGNLITGYLGNPAVVSKQEVLHPDAFIIRNQVSRLYNVYSDGTLVNSIATDSDRNALLANLIYERGFKRKRVCLVLSDRVAQLQDLRRRLLKKGIDDDDARLHVGEYEEDSYTVAYSYDKERWIRMDLRGIQKSMKQFARDLESGKHQDHPLIPATVKKAVVNGSPIYFDVVKRLYKPSEQELDYIANYCYIILATYKIFAKGVDYPRIDMGVEATPIGNATQPLGRTLRIPEGFNKPKPEWYALHDRFIMPPREGFGTDYESVNAVAQTMNHFFDKKASAREKALLKAKATIRYESGARYKEKA